MSKLKYPLKLKPEFKNIIWGGRTLIESYNKCCELDKLAESWELTVRPDGMNLIENGIYSGMTLYDYFSEYYALPENYGNEGDKPDFPVLIKLIDAHDKLSIQVHPCKTEMWYIVDAEEDAELVYGLKEKFDEKTFRSAVENGTVEDLLNYVKVKKGDVFFIPTGLVHAIGKGILIAEIQQNSNITYRVYDYMRRQPDGSLRELHVNEAISVIQDFSEEDITRCRFSRPATKDRIGALLAACDYFFSKQYNIYDVLELEAPEKESQFAHIMCLEGEGFICGGYKIKKGESYLIPGGFGSYSLTSQENSNLSVIVTTA